MSINHNIITWQRRLGHFYNKEIKKKRIFKKIMTLIYLIVLTAR